MRCGLIGGAREERDHQRYCLGLCVAHDQAAALDLCVDHAHWKPGKTCASKHELLDPDGKRAFDNDALVALLTGNSLPTKELSKEAVRRVEYDRRILVLSQSFRNLSAFCGGFTFEAG